MENNPLDEISKQIQDMFRKFGRNLAEANAQFVGQSFEPSLDLRGWLRLLRVLKEAANDKEILASPEASAFLEKILKLVGDAHCGISANEVFQPLSSEFISKNTSNAAKIRFEPNEKARVWAVSEWIKYKDEYQNNKTVFAYHYSRRILKEHGIPIGVRTISDRWLKGL